MTRSTGPAPVPTVPVCDVGAAVWQMSSCRSRPWRHRKLLGVGGPQTGCENSYAVTLPSMQKHTDVGTDHKTFNGKFWPLMIHRSSVVNIPFLNGQISAYLYGGFQLYQMSKFVTCGDVILKMKIVV